MFIKVGTALSVEKVHTQESFGERQADRKIVEYDPEFVYVSVRALTADKPNSNGDAFPHEELTRIDPILNRPVYASFVGKGVYINHKNTDDPRYAKGIVLDSRYVQANPDDKYVELLLAVDRRKDPIFARDVERGLINKFSMGASVQFTKCSICENTARRKEEFCEHIAKQKMREVEGKLAYEKCFGVTYNEISAVSDPADETAQTLDRVASTKSEKSAKSDNGTVVLVNEIRSAIKRLEGAMTNKKAAARKKVAQPDIPAGGPEPGVNMDQPPEPGLEPGVEGGEEEPVVEVLRIVEDLLSGNVPAADAVQQLEGLGIVPESGEGPEAPPGELGGEPEPPSVDMAPSATKREPFSAFIKRVAEEYAAKKKSVRGETRMTAKTAAEKSPKVDNQYPYKGKDNPTPKQHLTKPFKGRPEGDFAKDKKDYSKMYNYTAEFVGSDDRRQSAWNILDGNKPLWTVTAGAAFEDMLDVEVEKGITGYNRFSSRAYGEDLIRAILEDGLDETMKRVNATRVPAAVQKHAEFDEAKLIQAAEAKAADLAEEMVEDYRIRLIEGFKVALKLQNKNQLDNPIRAVAYEILTKQGLDGTLAEEIASGDVVEAHFDEALRKAMEYTEMEPAAFEEVKAIVDSAPHTKVVAASSDGGTDDVLAQAEAEAIASLRRRASRNTTLKSPAGEALKGNFDDNLRNAVRQGLRQKAPSSSAPTYRPHKGRSHR